MRISAINKRTAPKYRCDDSAKGAGEYRTPERPTATIAQVYALAHQMPGRYRTLALAAAFTGLRWGELIALRR